jgi:hypothetical protein
MKTVAFDPTAGAIQRLDHSRLDGVSATQTAAYATARLHHGVIGLLIASYGVLLLAFWILFAQSAVTAISLAICSAYFAMYFGVPIVMYLQTRKAAESAPAGSLGRFLRGSFETATGPISGWSALAQVLVVPVCVTFGAFCIGFIFNAWK